MQILSAVGLRQGSPTRNSLKGSPTRSSLKGSPTRSSLKVVLHAVV